MYGNTFERYGCSVDENLSGMSDMGHNVKHSH